MRSLAAAIAACNTAEVTAGGVEWRIVALNSAAISHERVQLLHVAIPTVEAMVEAQSIAEMTDPEERARRAARTAQAKIAQLTPEHLEAEQALNYRLIQAGVTHARDPESGVWEPMTITAPGTEPTDSSVPVDRLTPAMVTALGNAVWRLSTDGGEASQRIATFRRGP